MHCARFQPFHGSKMPMMPVEKRLRGLCAALKHNRVGCLPCVDPRRLILDRVSMWIIARLCMSLSCGASAYG